MSIIDDLECVNATPLISRLAGPLSPPGRIALRLVAEKALPDCRAGAKGAVYRGYAGLAAGMPQHAHLQPYALAAGF